MRHFFVLLVFLLCSFGLTFSVLLSTPADRRAAGAGGAKVLVSTAAAGGAEEERAFGSFEVRFGRGQARGWEWGWVGRICKWRGDGAYNRHETKRYPLRCRRRTWT